MIRKSWTVEAGQLVCRWSAVEERTDSPPSWLRLTTPTVPSGKGAPQTAFPEVRRPAKDIRRSPAFSAGRGRD
jgi:hypothetical protein